MEPRRTEHAQAVSPGLVLCDADAGRLITILTVVPGAWAISGMRFRLDQHGRLWELQLQCDGPGVADWMLQDLRALNFTVRLDARRSLHDAPVSITVIFPTSR